MSEYVVPTYEEEGFSTPPLVSGVDTVCKPANFGDQSFDPSQQQQQQLQPQQFNFNRQQLVPVNRETRHRGRASNCNIYICGIPPQWTNETLAELFSQFGPVITTRVCSRPGNASGGQAFGFALMSDPDVAATAVRALHGTMLDGRRLEVRAATRKAPMEAAAPKSADLGRALPTPPATFYPQQPVQHMMHPQSTLVLPPPPPSFPMVSAGHPGMATAPAPPPQAFASMPHPQYQMYAMPPPPQQQHAYVVPPNQAPPAAFAQAPPQFMVPTWSHHHHVHQHAHAYGQPMLQQPHPQQQQVLYFMPQQGHPMPQPHQPHQHHVQQPQQQPY